MNRSRPAVLVAVLTLFAVAPSLLGAAAPAKRRHPARPAGAADSATRAPAAAAKPGATVPEVPELFAAWHQPYGLPGATGTLTPSHCDDTTHVDTLWLSFQPTRDESTFIGIGGDIEIRALPGDTLGAFWDVGAGGANRGGLVMKLGRDPEFPGEQPWDRHGIGSVRFEREPTVARFRFFDVVATQMTIPVQGGHRYTAGCLLVRATKPGLGGCERPVCVGWGKTDVSFASGNEYTGYGGGSVGWGASEAACRPHPQAWRPKFDLPGAAPVAPDSTAIH